jgi:hypothetical protein
MKVVKFYKNARLNSRFFTWQTGRWYNISGKQLKIVMKIKIIPLMTAGILICVSAWYQDTATAYTAGETLVPVTGKKTETALPAASSLRSDTRLGSSNPMYGTYHANADGAGAITTNPHKTGGEFPYTLPFLPDTTGAVPVYRNTRPGSSSPAYDTCELSTHSRADGLGFGFHRLMLCYQSLI